MRENGVRSWICHHQALLSADHWTTFLCQHSARA
jgi:hypothetical protein